METRLTGLDFSRFIAAIIVFNSHFIGAFGLPISIHNSIHWVLSFFWNGELAVNYFFILSGFVLSYKYFIKDIPIILSDFYLKRFLRIYPLYIFLLLISALIIHFKHYLATNTALQTNWINSLMVKDITIQDILKESLLIFNTPSNSNNLILPPSWTLSVEIVYSLLVPFLIYICRKSTIWLLILILILHKLFFIDENLMLFGLGIILADIYTKGRLSIYHKNMYSILIVAGFLLVSMQTLLPYKEIKYITIVGFSLILIYLLHQKLFSFNKNTSLNLIINSSYSIYLVHIIIIKFFTPFLFNFIEFVYSPLNWFISYIITLMITIKISVVLFITLEQKFIKLAWKGNKIINQKFS